MKVSFHYPARCTGQPIDPEQLLTSERGLTGSEIACFQYAIELNRLGHDVLVYGRFTQVDLKWGSPILKFVPEDKDNFESLVLADAVVSWMSPDACRLAQPNQFRLYNEQCSDHGNTPYGWEPSVDCFATLSRKHREHMRSQHQFGGRQIVMPNGVDPERYRPGVKQPGKCVWASSHDRGLHHLLESWPLVKQLVPHATLDVFYNPTGMHQFAERPPTGTNWVDELQRRSAYCLEALPRLERLGVTMHGSVSRDRLRDELATAEVLAYPCDPVRFTETFGSTVLEAMASGCVPVLCLSDAFGELWADSSVSVYPPFAQNRATYVRLLTSVLLHQEQRIEVAAECRTRAEPYAWTRLGRELERLLFSRGAEGFEEFGT